MKTINLTNNEQKIINLNSNLSQQKNLLKKEFQTKTPSVNPKEFFNKEGVFPGI
ncbi:hypothetical protein KKC83_02440 [Patescibacteria group bacterium]|nr:hypothetical protein [Patescibacteria group bacterium]MCG2698605.1 hypothetical protein [Candidatus Parcubacteria bacterium]MBU4015050.1 hypothetical protein [Patescibacteria group bacterium]MBU4026375.1 hypothetical protein [Patescibacteria group bacterium]MBU4072640.1 hypothetical protein [Patescibacteria group bacterium]